MKNLEIYVYLHSIANGMAIVTRGDSDVGKEALPLTEISMTLDREKPRRILLSLPFWLADAKGLLPSRRPVTDMDGQLGEVAREGISSEANGQVGSELPVTRSTPTARGGANVRDAGVGEGTGLLRGRSVPLLLKTLVKSQGEQFRREAKRLEQL